MHQQERLTEHCIVREELHDDFVALVCEADAILQAHAHCQPANHKACGRYRQKAQGMVHGGDGKGE